MFYFREEELRRLQRFYAGTGKACAVYGRRRVGKTELILESLKNNNHCIYFQVAGFDYDSAVADFGYTIQPFFPHDMVIHSLRSFKEIFSYLSAVIKENYIVVIDEFPFLGRKNENVTAEFQWIIDHGLEHIKLVLSGSNTSFMRAQISDSSQPLYGRFDEILHVIPFTFEEVHILYPVFEEAMQVYVMTGGVAQYVMLFMNYGNVNEASEDLFFDRNGRLFMEAPNLLMQEFRDITSYVSILRAIGSGDKDSSSIAAKTNVDSRNINTYLSKLEEIEIVSPVRNIFSGKKRNIRYRIHDLFFRFYYSFVEPNISMINQIGHASRQYILNNRYSEYLGYVYEDIIRESLYSRALRNEIPFMPEETGKWWGNIYRNGKWMESEIDVAAVNRKKALVGECKYRNRKAGISELENLKYKAGFALKDMDETVYLLASAGGFTDELLEMADSDLVLIEKDQVIRPEKG